MDTTAIHLATAYEILQQAKHSDETLRVDDVVCVVDQALCQTNIRSSSTGLYLVWVYSKPFVIFFLLLEKSLAMQD